MTAHTRYYLKFLNHRTLNTWYPKNTFGSKLNFRL